MPIRAVRDRRTTAGGKRWSEAVNWPLTAAARQSLAAAARPGRPARHAEVELRWGEVELAPPKRSDRHLPPIRLRVVWVSEPSAPAGLEPLEWMLLTSLPVAEAEAAWQVVEYDRPRWQIERFFHVLKQGCQVEALQLQTRARLEAAVAVYLIVAYRILQLQGRAKVEPNASALTAFSPGECQTLGQIHQPRLAPEALDLREATRRLARLGGYTARKSDGPPGPKTLWLGWQRLADFIAARRLFLSANPLV